MANCPAGHATQATDYCDVCGTPVVGQGDIGAEKATSAPLQPATKTCPHCGGSNPPNALFCESCGYDFTTGEKPHHNLLDLDAPVQQIVAPVSLTLPDQKLAQQLSTPVHPPRGTNAAIPSTQGELMIPPTAQEIVENGHEEAGVAMSDKTGSEDPTEVEPQEPVALNEAPAEEAEQAKEAEEKPAGEVAEDSEEADEKPQIELEYVAEVWIDPDWYKVQESEEQMPSPGLPTLVPLLTAEILVGRLSKSKNINPDIDCGMDTGCSRSQAKLTCDGSRWFVEDLGSSNGTFVGPALGPLPTEPIKAGRVELKDDDRIYVGAWTRIVVRKATPDEKTSLIPTPQSAN